MRAERSGDPDARVEPFVPSYDLKRIDSFAARVIRDRDRVWRWRVPVSRPWQWFTHDVREAIAAEVTPIVFGRGVFRDELERRFRRAVAFVSALDERFRSGRSADERAVRMLADVL